MTDMTEEKAIEIINNRFNIMDYHESESLGDALDAAVEALKAQIPKKPIPFHYRYIFKGKEEEQILFRCSVCAQKGIDLWNTIVGTGKRRCERCDTLLDWSGKENL